MQSQQAFRIRKPRLTSASCAVTAKEGPAVSTRAQQRLTRASTRRSLAMQIKQQPSNRPPTSAESARFAPLMEGHEPLAARDIRWRLYTNALQELDAIVAATFETMHAALIADVTAFVRLHPATTNRVTTHGTAVKVAREIPCALLTGGFSHQDNMPLFQSIADELADDTRETTADGMDCSRLVSRVVLLDQQDHSTLKAALTELNDSLRPACLDDSYAAHDISWLATVDPSIDERWTIIISDITTFAADVLRDLILILHLYQPSDFAHLPFVLVLGSSASFEIDMDIMTRPVLECLCIKRLSVNTPHQWLDILIREMLMKPSNGRLKLSALALERQVFGFKENNLSVVKLLNIVRFAVMDHYYSNPLAVLFADDLGGLITPVHLEMIRSLPSFKRHIESLMHTSGGTEPGRIHRRLRGPQLAHDLSQLKATLLDVDRMVYLAVQTVWRVNEKMKKPDFQYMYQAYIEVLKPGFISERSGTRLIKVIRLFSRSAVLDLMETVIELCDEAGAASLADNLISAIQTAAGEISDDEEDDANLARDNEPSPELARALIDFISNLLKRTVELFMAHPLVDIFYYNSSAKIRRAFSAEVRATLDTGLSAPNIYLGPNCPEDPFDPSQEDLSVVFNLYRESGKQLNLADWFGSFAVTVESTEKMDSPETLVRFLQSIATLQYLGYIKPHTSNKEVATKLIW